MMTFENERRQLVGRQKLEDAALVYQMRHERGGHCWEGAAFVPASPLGWEIHTGIDAVAKLPMQVGRDN